MDMIYIGATPNDEECAQVSEHTDYMPQMRAELRAYKNQLTRMYPPPEGGDARFDIKWERHDFGTYGEVVARFDGENDAEIEWAMSAELGAETWDDQARDELAAAGFPPEVTL